MIKVGNIWINKITTLLVNEQFYEEQTSMFGFTYHNYFEVICNGELTGIQGNKKDCEEWIETFLKKNHNY